MNNNSLGSFLKNHWIARSAFVALASLIVMGGTVLYATTPLISFLQIKSFTDDIVNGNGSPQILKIDFISNGDPAFNVANENGLNYWVFRVDFYDYKKDISQLADKYPLVKKNDLAITKSVRLQHELLLRVFVFVLTCLASFIVFFLLGHFCVWLFVQKKYSLEYIDFDQLHELSNCAEEKRLDNLNKCKTNFQNCEKNLKRFDVNHDKCEELLGKLNSVLQIPNNILLGTNHFSQILQKVDANTKMIRFVGSLEHLATSADLKKTIYPLLNVICEHFRVGCDGGAYVPPRLTIRLCVLFNKINDTRKDSDLESGINRFLKRFFGALDELIVDRGLQEGEFSIAIEIVHEVTNYPISFVCIDDKYVFLNLISCSEWSEFYAENMAWGIELDSMNGEDSPNEHVRQISRIIESIVRYYDKELFTTDGPRSRFVVDSSYLGSDNNYRFSGK
ncbi:hypothetical protein [Maridesulfovibrio sp.]|uniref:hypothetical protein n=1 Tax=Maridesulfovibrio sp. TaxID=2795000 RepID=UPI0029CA7051|nr:hypothetical protein [Maridesulfovibrio sp.]